MAMRKSVTTRQPLPGNRRTVPARGELQVEAEEESQEASPDDYVEEEQGFEEEEEGPESDITVWENPKTPQLSKHRAKWALSKMGADLHQFDKYYRLAPPGRQFGPRAPSGPLPEEIEAYKQLKKDMNYDNFVNSLHEIHGWNLREKGTYAKIQGIQARLFKWAAQSREV